MKHESKNRRKHRRAISLLLCTSLLFSQAGFASYGDEITEIVEEDPLEHVHTEDCYTGNLICGYDQITVATGSDAGHVHTDDCYELSCGYEQFEDEEELENDLPDDESDDLLEDVLPEDEIVSDDLLNDDLLENDLTEDKLNPDNLTETIAEKETQTKIEKSILITEFKELDEDVQYRNVETWTGVDELNLPESLEAMASFSDEEPEPVVINGITWELDGDNGELAGGEGEINGSFTFTAVLPGHYLIDSGVEAPEIYVQVGSRQVFDISDYDANDISAFLKLLEDFPVLEEGIDKNDPITWIGSGSRGIVEWAPGYPHFLKALNIDRKGLEGQLDVRAFKHLQYLRCSDNHLTEIIVDNDCIDIISCSGNNISALNLSDQAYQSLKTLTCNHNLLERLDVSKSTSLRELNCSNNYLTSLSVNSGINELNCSFNELTALDVNNCSYLKKLSCNDNKLETLTLVSSRFPNALKILKCDKNKLTSLDLTKLTNLGTFTCEGNPLSSLTLPNEITITNAPVDNGISKITDIGNASSQCSITLKAEPNNNYKFSAWNCSALSNQDKTSNPITFTPTSATEISAVFVEDNPLQDVKNKIEGHTSYTATQSEVNTQDAVKTWLSEQINAIEGMDDTGITITADSIIINSFTSAIAGNADNANGINGSFSFTVTLTYNGTTDATKKIDGVITAAAYSNQTNTELVAAAKSIIEGTAYSVSQADANTQTDVKTWLVQTINSLPGYSDTGIAITADNIDISSFNAATAGDEDNHNGSNGTFTFQVTLQKGAAQDATAAITGTIAAQQYVPSENPDDNKPDDNKPDNKPDDNKPDNNKPDDNKPDDNKPDDNKPDNNKPDNNKPDNNKPIPDNSGSSTDNSYYDSDDSDSDSYYDTPSLTAESTPVTAEIIVGQPDNYGNTVITAGQIKDALNAARREARQKKTLNSGVSVTVRFPEGITQASIDPDGLSHLSASDVASVCFDYKGVSFTFYQDTITAMNGLAADSIIFAAKPVSGLTGESLTAISTYPVYELSAAYMKNGVLMPLTTVGSVNAAIAYTPGASEDINALYAVSVDSSGNVHRIPDSKYNPANSAVCFTVNNFSTIGISSIK
ncbi:hypothetical protein [Clostridium sp. MCC353]|uniref:InlB B-repeat-containing protein n=1 Tax=Clostridium sp. MCC353 TaxID=2592646 RepID=UPI001C01CE7A|nr:hypothetical protein [Clostridium sp. MCC353]